jgi:hypothetical protein
MSIFSRKQPREPEPMVSHGQWVILVVDGTLPLHEALYGLTVVGPFKDEGACQRWSQAHASTRVKGGPADPRKFRWIPRQVVGPVATLEQPIEG